jgi:UDP-N-acetylmuramoylalanine--D-glutamate ligase
MIMQLRDKQVAIVGLGESGVAAARLCLSQGARVVGFDEAPPERLGAGARALKGATLVSGPIALDALDGSDVVVVSPGVPNKDAIARAEAAGALVIGELELAARFLDAPIVLVGGTNGKSTVTAWVAAMLEASDKRVFCGGNYGTPLSAAVGEPYDVLVVEISSFQAERVPTLHARVHALLNITDDHLDRYASFSDYANAKGNPFVNMDEHDRGVVPFGDAACAAQAARGRAKTITFGGEGEVASEHGHIVDRAHGGRYPIDALRVRGLHNLTNACAAVASARAAGASEAGVGAALASFAGLPHRHVLVRELGGVRFYDDSKATNVGAAVTALSGMEEPRAVLIAGGRDKLGSYAPLVEVLRKRGRALVLIGEAADRIAETAGGAIAIERAGSMEEAVSIAARLAQPGDAVLLSPACSSFDMFESYKARGDAFCAAVRALGAAS